MVQLSSLAATRPVNRPPMVRLDAEGQGIQSVIIKGMSA